MRKLCPRCDSETLELGQPSIDTGQKKQVKVSLRQCPKCKLIFHEAC